jgi:hypothetical protein
MGAFFSLDILVLSIALWLASIVGWLMNLWDVVVGFVHSTPMTTLFIGRLIGLVVAPLGAILGYF